MSTHGARHEAVLYKEGGRKTGGCEADKKNRRRDRTKPVLLSGGGTLQIKVLKAKKLKLL